MQQQTPLKRKKRKSNRILNITGDLDSEESESTVHEIRRRLLLVFKNHIGRENAITPFDLFYSVYRVNPQSIDIYRRGYLWIILRRIIKEMRKDKTIFIVNEKTRLYVLKTVEECYKLKNGIDRHIENLKGIKAYADEWIREEKWRKL